jgi:O-antigen/teichoic acid export membrane protein
VVHFLLVLGAVRLGWLSIGVVLGLLVAEYLVLTLALGPRLFAGNVARGAADTDGSLRGIVREFVVFCKPLAIFGTVGVVYMFADRWLLQNFGGAREQGLFSIGQQIATVSLLATTSIMDVFWKEIAEAKAHGDTARATQLYMAVRHALFFYTASISCGVIPHAQDLLAGTVGSDFDGAWMALTIMLFYPIHQSLSLVQGTFAYATGRPKAHTHAGILTMVLSIPITYVLLAPADAAVPGLALGAVGLALKLVVLQILSVGLVAHALVRDQAGWSHDYAYQIGVLTFLVALGLACRWLAAASLAALGLSNAVATVAVSSCAYTAVCMATVYRFPQAAGLTRPQVQRAVRLPARWLRVAPQS